MIVRGLRLLVKRHGLFSSATWEDYATVFIVGKDPSSENWGRVHCYESAEEFEAQFYVEADQRTRSDLNLEPGSHITTTDVPRACLKFASESLNECSDNHPFCNAHSQAALPKRLIEVRYESEHQDLIRLIDDTASNIPQGTNYAALSYCWGNDLVVRSAMLSMNKANLAELTLGFSFSRLPTVFCDAVTTTRSLGISYLWVDALCIAQGDIDDWRTESLRMRETYSGAYVTIAASSSNSCVDSFLAMPGRSLNEGFEIRTGNGKMEQKVFVRLNSCKNESSSANGQERSAVDSRGWTLQEALLSTRLLLIRRNLAVYSCLASPLAEGGSRPTNESVLDLRCSWFSLHDKPKAEKLSFELPFVLWHELVEEYSSRQLTMSQDRLLAIAGLASLLKDRGPDNNAYIGGIWEASFVPDLSWYLVRPSESCECLPGPSWTWTSTNGQLLIPGP